MSSGKYSQTAYFDFSTTASCGGSPIILTSIGTGCNAAVSLSSDSSTCTPFGKTGSEYTMYSQKCNIDQPFTLSGFTRNYVVKSVFASSDNCEKDTLQAFAVAADSTCHTNPQPFGNFTYIKANCNGDQPIWQDCKDSNCQNCDTINYTNQPCQVTGAGASVKVECVKSTTSVSPTGPGGRNRTSDLPDDTFNKPSSATSLKFKFVYKFALLSILVVGIL